MSNTIATLFVFESDSSPGKTYQTLLYVDGSSSCECPGWKFKRKTSAQGERTCKHARYVEAGLANQHAIKVVEYSNVVTVPRIRQKAMAQATLQPRTGSRYITLEDEA